MKTSPSTRHNNKPVIVPGDDEYGYSSGQDMFSTGSTKTLSISKNKAHQMRRTNKERQLRNEKVFNGGPWSEKERLDFLRGLRMFGPGKWKKIQTILTTRSNIQIKSHGQKVLHRMKKGHNVYKGLEALEMEEAATETKRNSPSPAPEDCPTVVSSRSSSPCPSDTDDTVSTVSDVSTCPSMVSEVSWDEAMVTKSGPPKKRLKWLSQPDNVVSVPNPIPQLRLAKKPLVAKKPLAIKRAMMTKKTSAIKKSSVIKKPKKSSTSIKPTSCLSIKEANVVLALVGLAEPIKLSAQVATV